MAEPCTHPGCTGTIEDGYCNVCGLPPGEAAGAPASVPPPAPAAGPTGPAGQPVSAGTRSSTRLASAPIGTARAAGGSRSTRRLATASTRLRTARLGAGITSVPPIPHVDPRAVVMADPVVPEERRHCASCGGPVGRSRGGQPGRTEGFCPACRAPFSFSPKLQPGELVAGQYEVVGCLAHGGLGWIYLAQDRNVSDRWVVLKGLLNSQDPDAVAAAIAERRFLAEVEHPLIVEIYNFVRHGDAGYIVMEYVGGRSLKTILKERREASGRHDPIPVDQAIAYLVEVLPAFQYLHDAGLLYCDFKPDNIIQVGDAVKLIDLGGVRRIDDHTSAIYGTVGFQAPEVAEVGPSIASDLYTIGRTLAVLSFEFRGYQSAYATTLPPAEEVELLARHDSLHRLLLKACAPDPADRFQSADELRVQLLGVLREIVAERAAASGAPAPHPPPSALFDTPAVAGDTLTWDQLPALLVDSSDPQAAWLAGVGVADPRARADVLASAPGDSVEVHLAQARAWVEAGANDRADEVIRRILTEDPWEWRAVWIAGLRALAAGDTVAAQGSFNAVYGQVPGELAPKLALALACEQGGQPGAAEGLYAVCARTDASYTAPAAFGIARIRAAQGDLAGAVAALDLVPPVSRSYVQARRRRADLLVRSDGGLASLAQALESIDGLTIEPRDRLVLRVDVLGAALRAIAGGAAPPDARVGGIAAEEPALRDGLEAAYRELAALTDDEHERVALVDAANRSRRWTVT